MKSFKWFQVTVQTEDNQLKADVLMDVSKSSLKHNIEQHWMENQMYGNRILKIEKLNNLEDFENLD